ncbi:formate dehydrogenase accessory sulfurtransferase FdhD [Nocardioides kribbensis]|uniref:formate dehydrogenase accessory sulfurtransferase FdhD n=1 Tax=Nocardioides kribbensis TaxID=305517 RepID=UPI00187AAB1C|nr:formate dehydrogenase accessory sulfurtransferase FdhD [Nocardioides kribbensis]
MSGAARGLPGARARRPGPTVRTRVEEHRAGPDGDAPDEVRRHEDRLVTEEPLEIRLAWPGAEAHRAWVTMRTPGHDFELAAGWAVHEGLPGPAGIAGIAYCTDVDLAPEQEFNVVTLTLAEPPARPPGHRHDALSAGSSACGVCGADSVSAVLDIARGARWEGATPTADVVRRLPDLLRERQPVFARTGGIHAAGLFTADGEAVLVREDVGRHNAVDKVSGARAMAGERPGGACLVVSGRAGFELVQKAVTAGFGSLVSVGAPTSLSAQLAAQSGLELWGFTSPRRTVRYV